VEKTHDLILVYYTALTWFYLYPTTMRVNRHKNWFLVQSIMGPTEPHLTFLFTIFTLDFIFFKIMYFYNFLKHIGIIYFKMTQLRPMSENLFELKKYCS